MLPTKLLTVFIFLFLAHGVGDKVLHIFEMSFTGWDCLTRT